MKTKPQFPGQITTRPFLNYILRTLLIIFIAMPLLLANQCQTKKETNTNAEVEGPAFHKWAPTPPMGWNSWDCYGPTVVEDEVKANADYIHSKGLKFGIYIMRGIPVIAVKKNTPILGSNARAQDIYTTEGQCEWLRDMYTVVDEKEGAQEYYNSLFKLYASWGIDFVKVDDLSGCTKEIEMVRKAIDNSGRPIVLSISPGGNRVKDAELLKNNANMWRTTDDFWDNWPALKNEFAVCNNWASYGGTGYFPDADMLPLGKIGLRAERGKPRMSGFTKDEQYTLMSLFAIFRSPLMFGGDLPSNDEFTLSLITNKDVLEVNQHSINGKQLFREKDLIAWTADDPKTGDKYLALFNASDQQPIVEGKMVPPDATPITVKFDQLGLTGTHVVKDLWSDIKLGKFKDEFTRTINRHGAGLYRISAK